MKLPHCHLPRPSFLHWLFQYHLSLRCNVVLRIHFQTIPHQVKNVQNLSIVQRAEYRQVRRPVPTYFPLLLFSISSCSRASSRILMPILLSSPTIVFSSSLLSPVKSSSRYSANSSSSFRKSARSDCNCLSFVRWASSRVLTYVCSAASLQRFASFQSSRAEAMRTQFLML